MIFLVNTTVESEDRKLSIEAQSLRRNLDKNNRQSKIYNSLDENKSLQQLKAGDELYIVGHGSRLLASISGLNAKQLFDCLINSGLNPYLKRLNIHLICCHAGYKKTLISKSFASFFYEQYLKALGEFEVHHRQAENSLPTLRAPKHIIGFNFFKKGALGLKPENYLLYEKKKLAKEKELSAWLNENEVILDDNDFQTIGKLNAYSNKY